MKYCCTIISVADVNAARKFYEDLFGLEAAQDFGLNLAFTCGLTLQQDFDGLIRLPKDSVLKESNNIELYFEELDFDGFLDNLKEYPDIEYLGGVAEQSWGQRAIRFYDLDGHIIEVGEDMKMVVRRFLDSGMTMEEAAAKIYTSASDLKKLLDS